MGPTPVPTLTGSIVSWAAGIDDAPSAGFRVVDAPHTVGAGAAALGDGDLASHFGADGFVDAAASHLFREVPSLETANGPVDLLSTVVRFRTVDGARNAFSQVVVYVDHLPSSAPTSAGPLGDDAHAVTEIATAEGGVEAVQVTLVWRVADVVTVLRIRGRLGATGVGDALVTAHRLAGRERS